MVKHIAKIVLGDEMYYVKDTEARNALIDQSEKGVAGGVATLDNSGKVPSSQLPESYASVSKLTVGETEYNPIDGNITIPAYPTTLPASDVSAWAKSDTKPSYTKSEIGLDNVTNDAQVKRSEMGAAEGVATLDTAGKIPSSQLPSYVDDVLEYAGKSSFPATGETGKIYVDTSTNLSWRWGGTTYVEISPSLALGETSSTAYAGDKGKALADKLSGIESGAQAHKAPTTAEVKSALGTGSGTSKYLREDGTWQTPPDNNTTYSGSSTVTLSGTTFSLTKANVTTALGYTPPTSDTNTHYVTRIYAGASGTAANAAATSPYIKITDDNTYRNQIRLVGGGATTVSSDANGNITISSTDTNTWPSKVSQLTNDSGFLTAASFINNNKGTSVGKIMVADASNGLGYSTPSNLATVLNIPSGSSFSHAGVSNTNCNSMYPDLNKFGVWACRYSSNSPANFGFLMAFRWGSGSDCLQVFFGEEETGIWYRGIYDGYNGTNWTSWKKLTGS